ncbi:MAG: hypothetical protein RJA07_2081 [Bacteroidota bacterium]|jgi:hypothetical protein
MLGKISFAQDMEMSSTVKEKIEAEKVAFITKKMDLTPQESQIFWPVYNQFRKELEATRQDKKDLLHDAKKNYDKMTDAEIEKAIIESFQMEQHELDLKKKYYTEFKKVISGRKIIKLYRAERQWTLYLVQRLKELQQDK